MTGSRHAELDAAYRATAYFVDGPRGRFAVRVGRESAEADALAAEFGADAWAFITAYNPGSNPAPDEVNRVRHKELEAAVVGMGRRYFLGEGKGDDGRWPAEPSLLAPVLCEDEARRLARRFGQAAVVFGERGKPARLVWADDGRR